MKLQLTTYLQCGPFLRVLVLLLFGFFLGYFFAIDWRATASHAYVYFHFLGSKNIRAKGPPNQLLNCSLKLFVSIPNHGLGNKLQWLGSAFVLATSSRRCLSVFIPSGEVFEDWGLTMIQHVQGLDIVSGIPDDVTTLHVDNVTDADGHNCLKVSTNCHHLSEGSIVDSFLASSKDVSVASGFLAFKPHSMTLMEYDFQMTEFLQHFEVLPHSLTIVDSTLQKCLKASSNGVVIGVHFRSNDNCLDHNKLSLIEGGACGKQSQSITAVLRVLNSHKGASIFFASDNIYALAVITESLLPHGVTIVTSGSSDAIVDLRILSKTHIIVGSKFSTYSYTAARWGGVSLIEAGLDDGSYDFVLGSHYLEHLSNPLRALVSMRRVLKPGGLLILILPAKEKTFDVHRGVASVEDLIYRYLVRTDESDMTAAHIDLVALQSSLQDDPGLLSQASSAWSDSPYEYFLGRSMNNFAQRGIHQFVYDVRLLKSLMKVLNFEVILGGTDADIDSSDQWIIATKK